MVIKEPVEKETPEKSKSSVNFMLIFVCMLVVFVVGAGMVVGYFKFFGQDSGSEAAEGDKEIATVSADLGEFTANLADPGNHFLKTKVTIEYTKDKKIEELVTGKKHQIIDVVLLTLRQKTISEVNPPAANDELKTELIKAINDQLGVDAVQEIYFTQYFAQ